MIFAIVNKESLKVEKIYEASEKLETGTKWSWTALEPFCQHIEVPESLDKDCVKAVRNEDDEIILEADTALVAAKAAAEKAGLVQMAYDDMDKDVYAQMKTVFGTNKSDSATAFYETWKLMAEDPGAFANADLVDQEGNPLDTEEKITTYANARIAAVKAYSVYRMQRIKQFQDERASIMGS